MTPCRFLQKPKDPLNSAIAFATPMRSQPNSCPTSSSQTCRRFPSESQSGKTARVERLIQSGAWTDAALALIDLELPQWQIRRIAYDEGEWHCALSRQRELPEWLDQPVEARHTDLALAILSAFVEAQQISTPVSRPSVPAVLPDPNPLYEPVLSDNFA